MVEAKRYRAPKRDIRMMATFPDAPPAADDMIIRAMVLDEVERWPEKMPREIAKALSISVGAVVAAGSYWQVKGVVTIDEFGRMLRRSKS